jgi:glycosyltransferase involved in cell wall biosynthesis
MDINLSIIIPFWSSKEILKKVVLSANQLHPLEIIVIADKATDNIAELKKTLGCKVILKDKKLKENSRPVLGVNASKGNILLFLDGDIIISPTKLTEFIAPLLTGDAEVVLNNLDNFLKVKQTLSPSMVWHQILNEVLERKDLNLDSLLTFPHAFTREVVTNIGQSLLVNPLLFQMRMIDQGWKISRRTATELPPTNILPVANDEQVHYSTYFKALTELLDKKGKRGGFSDGGKRIDILMQLKKNKKYPTFNKGRQVMSSLYGGKQLSVIIPAQNEEATIKKVIMEAWKISPMEIIVVVNGSNDETSSIAHQLGATVIEYPERLGHNVGRAIGAMEASGDILLFIDADFSIPAKELYPFANAVMEGTDLALNDLTGYLAIQYPLHIVSAFKYGLNLLCQKEELGFGSLLAVPHAISRTCLENIGYETLVCPSLAQVKALLNGFNVACAHSVDVLKPNKMRPEQHLANCTGGGNRTTIMNWFTKSSSFPYYQKKYTEASSITKGWGISSTLYNGKQLTIIIPAHNDGATIDKVIREARKIEPLEVIVVASGSNDDTVKIAKTLGTTVVEFPEELDLDTSRAVGVLASKGDIIYFVEASLKGQTQAELRIMGDHLEAISYLIEHINKNEWSPLNIHLGLT